MNYNMKCLLSLTNQLRKEGKSGYADVIDKNFKEFLELLEKGELNFDFTFTDSPRSKLKDPYSNRGRRKNLSSITGP